MKDVEYLFLCQMGYLNWQDLTPSHLEKVNTKNSVPALIKTPNFWRTLKESWHKGKKIIDKYDEYDLRFILNYTPEKDGETLFNFDDWEFIYSGYYKEIFTKVTGETGIKNNHSTCYFKGSIFRNGREVVLVLTGITYSNVIFKNHFTSSDFSRYIDFANERNAAYLFYQLYLKEFKRADDILHFTGHSFGGGLAQFLHIITKGKHPTVTWNPIGFEEIYEETPSKNNKFLFPKKAKGFYELRPSTIEKITNMYFKKNNKNPISSIITSPGAKSDIFNLLSDDEYLHYRSCQKDSEITEVNFPYISIIDDYKNIVRYQNLLPTHIISIYYHLLISYFFYDRRDKALTAKKLKNYVTTEEWSDSIEKKIGRYINVITGEHSSPLDEKLHFPNYKKNISHHNIGDFFMFIDDTGTINPSKIRDELVSGAINTILSMDFGSAIIQKYNTWYLQKENINSFNIFSYVLDIIKGNKRSFNEKNIRYIEILKKNLTEKVPYSSEYLTVESDSRGYYISIGAETSLRKICNFHCDYKRRIYLI